MQRSTRHIADRAIDSVSESVRDAAAHAARQSDREVAALLDAAVDFSARLRTSTLTLRAALDRQDLEQAVRLSGAIAALARLAESRVLEAAQRRRGALAAIDSMLAALPEAPSERVVARREQADRRRGVR